MADNDAIDEFASEDPGEPRPADDVAADLPLYAPPEVYLHAAPVIDDGVVPGVEDRYFHDVSDVPAEDTHAPADEDHSYANDHSAYAEVYLDQSPAPIESSGRIQIVAALATVGLLGIMYVALVQQRSAALVSIPSPPSQAAVTPEPTDVAPVLPPVTEDAVPPRPNVYVPRPFDDPFGLTRGLSPSLPPPENFDVRPPAPAATPESAPPAAAAAAASTPPPATPPFAPPSPAPSTAANVAPAPVVAPPAASPSSAAAASATAAPAATTPVATTRAVPPSTSVAPPPAASPAAAPAAGSAPAAAAPAAAAAIDSNRNGIQSTLARYRKAFSSLNASEVREVWPTVNERNLSRAFDRLEQQDVSFDRCQIEVANDRAEATCNGTARYVPRVGSRTPRVDSREWRFNLVKVRDQWLIGALDAR